jgi:catechol 2,3-dioxygenase-like lactoylglutathione lyase family enzyme
VIKYKDINHLALVTTDMDKTILFWRDLLDMRLTGGVAKRGNKQYFFQVSESCLLGFFEWPKAEPFAEKEAGAPTSEGISFDHVCFEVDSEDSLWFLKDKLNAADIWVSEVIDNGFIHSIFTFDPNGISVEICHRVEGIDMTKDLRMVDSAPSVVTLQGRTPQPYWPEVKEPTPVNGRVIYHGELSLIIRGDDALKNSADAGDKDITRNSI